MSSSTKMELSDGGQPDLDDLFDPSSEDESDDSPHKDGSYRIINGERRWEPKPEDIRQLYLKLDSKESHGLLPLEWNMNGLKRLQPTALNDSQTISENAGSDKTSCARTFSNVETKDPDAFDFDEDMDSDSTRPSVKEPSKLSTNRKTNPAFAKTVARFDNVLSALKKDHLEAKLETQIDNSAAPAMPSIEATVVNSDTPKEESLSLASETVQAEEESSLQHPEEMSIGCPETSAGNSETLKEEILASDTVPEEELTQVALQNSEEMITFVGLETSEGNTEKVAETSLASETKPQEVSTEMSLEQSEEIMLSSLLDSAIDCNTSSHQVESNS